jgi:beta-lactamase superfamily II metal-dependent hydrolase
VLLDAGSSTLSDPLRTCIEPFLRHEQRRSIDRLFLSHGDYDHISAAQRLVPEYDVREVLTSAQFRRHARESKPCEALLQALDRSGHSPHLVAAGDRFQIGHDAQVQVLWPPAGCAMNSNNAGVVLRITCAGRSILFPADIQEPAELELLKNPQQLRSDILVAPHHGSRELSTARFIAAVHPQLILASNDARLTTKQRLFDGEVGDLPLLRTSRCGAITVEIDQDGAFRIIPCRPPPGWTGAPGGD